MRLRPLAIGVVLLAAAACTPDKPLKRSQAPAVQARALLREEDPGRRSQGARRIAELDPPAYSLAPLLVAAFRDGRPPARCDGSGGPAADGPLAVCQARREIALALGVVGEGSEAGATAVLADAVEQRLIGLGEIQDARLAAAAAGLLLARRAEPPR